MQTGEHETLATIGARLRSARKQHRMSLRELGSRADVTASFLSQLERGLAQPSIITLRRICDVLDISVSHALAENDPINTPGVHITRKHARGQMVPPTDDVVVDMLVTTPGRPFELLMVKLSPGTATAPDLVAHDAREAMLVLDGIARFETAHTSVELSAGDTVYLNSTAPHRMINAGDVELVFIDCIVGNY